MSTPPEPAHDQQPVPAPPSPGGISKQAAALIAVVAAVVVGGVVALVFILAGGEEEPPAEAETFIVSGTLTLDDASGIQGAAFTSGSTCMGTGGYDDIVPGAQVTVYDNAGAILAVGALEDGSVLNPGSCLFKFHVEGVPIGHNLYQVEVSHRGKLAFTEADGRAARVDLTLG